MRQSDWGAAAVYLFAMAVWCGMGLVVLRNWRRRQQQHAPAPDAPAGFVDEFGCLLPNSATTAALTVQRQQAQRRAHDLLCEHLSQLQQATLATHAYFDVTGSRGGQYRIWADVDAYNVVERDAHGGELYTLCVRPTEPIPNADRLLAQKLLLESDEERFWRIANAMHGAKLPYEYRVQGGKVPPWERCKPMQEPRLGTLPAMWREPNGSIWADNPPEAEWERLATVLADHRGCSKEEAWRRLIAAERILNGPHGFRFASRPTYRTAMALAGALPEKRVNELVPTVPPAQGA